MKLLPLQPEHEAALRLGNTALAVGWNANTDGFYLIEKVGDIHFNVLYEIRDPTIWMIEMSTTIEIRGKMD